MSASPTPPPGYDRELWRAAYAGYLARRERLRKLREDLAAARAAGKAIRHQQRLQRAAHTEGTTS